MSNNISHWVMDYETLSNCFLGCFEHYKTDEVHVFTIGKLRNDLDKLLAFFQQNITNHEWHISFNGLNFDSQITQFIIINANKLKTLSGEDVAKLIYQEAQDIITVTSKGRYPKWSEKDLKIRQIDVFRLNHWDNPAKNSSLKWIQCSMDWHNVLDMPIHHTEKIETVPDLQKVAFYCRNDVSSTKAIMTRDKKEIELRGQLTKDYGINLYSASEPKISKELFLLFLAKKTGIAPYELRQLRTERTSIDVNKLILPHIKFEVPEFKEMLDKFRNLILDATNLKGTFNHSIKYRGVETFLGLGGVHGARRGIYESDKDMVIMSSDVKSFYPNLSIRNKWSPAHLDSDAFCELYEWFYDERIKIPKKDPRNYVYKIILNATYGLSNDKHSFLYDPEFTMRITINGQLSLMMLYTMIGERIPGAVPIMQNTDGLEYLIPGQYVDTYLAICKEWEDITKLVLEHDQYQKLIVPDVNTYIGVFKDEEISREDWLKYQKELPENLFKRKDGKFYMAKTKCKGRFEFKDRKLHKNKSFTVVSKAIYDYFVHGVDPEKHLERNNNIFDYCGQAKCKGEWKFKEILVENNQIVERDIQKTLRYYISDTGSKILKCNKVDGRETNVEAGTWMLKVFNLYEEKPFEEYNINKKFYLNKINKEIRAMMPDEQLILNLF